MGDGVLKPMFDSNLTQIARGAYNEPLRPPNAKKQEIEVANKRKATTSMYIALDLMLFYSNYYTVANRAGIPTPNNHANETTSSHSA